MGEDAIRSRHELYRLVLENASDLIAVASADGRVLYASPSHERVLGWTSEELVGFDVLDRVHADDVAAVREGLEAALASGVSQLRPVRFQRRDGTWVVLESRLTAVLDEDTGETLLLAVSRDVTAERSLYEAAAAAQLRFELLAGASDALGATLDLDRALAAFVDRVVPRFADRCTVHLLAEDGSLSPDGDADLLETIAAVLRTGEPALGTHEGGWRIVAPLVARGRSFGALSFVTLAGSRPYGRDDAAVARELARRVAVAVDNAQLYREAQERGRAARILASVGDGVVLVDREGVVRYWNDAAAAITGLAWQDVLDRAAADAIPGWAAIDPLVPIGGPPQSLPLQLGAREGWISISGVAVEEGTVYAFRDLSEERALEELRADFVATVSHELRTPLAAIYGAVQTLRREDVELADEQREQLLGVVGSEADRLARTVNDILWASRLDASSLSIESERCDAGGLAEAVVAAQRTHLPETIRLELEVEGGLPAVVVDADKVRQVLVNLVDNAVKYSPEGGRVVVRVAQRGASIRFSVADEGLGIPFADQRRIFEKFYRLDPQLTRGVGGTGLGLYISHELVRRMHGRIWVQSTPGRGSTFSVELPIAPENESGRPEGRPAEAV